MVYIRVHPHLRAKKHATESQVPSPLKESRPYLDLFFIIIIMTNYNSPHAHTLPAFSFFFLIHPHIGIAKLN